MKMSDQQILQLYEGQYKPFGKNKHELALDLGLTHGQVDHAMRRARGSYGITGEEDANIGSNTAEITSGDVMTLADLLELYELSLDEWEVIKVVANKWEVGRKANKIDVVWEAGKQSGTIYDDGTIFTAPLFQIKAWLVRKEPVAVKPVVRPIVFKNNLKRYSFSNANTDGVRTALILPDAQIGFSRSLRTGGLTPFHDRQALSAVVDFARLVRPDRIIIQGDWFDLPDWQDRFIRGPELWGVMQPALYEAAWWLRQLLATTKQMDFLEGNHELRMKIALYNHLQSAYDLRQVSELGVVVDIPAMSIPGLLSLDRLGIEWHDGYPDNKVWLNEYLAVEHGSSVSASPGGTANKLLANKDYSVIFGHVHRHESATSFVVSRDTRRVIQAICPGTLSRIDGQVPGNTERQNWNQGVVLASYDDSPDFSLAHYPIHNGVLHYGTIRIEGEDLTEEIESAEGVGFF